MANLPIKMIRTVVFRVSFSVTFKHITCTPQTMTASTWTMNPSAPRTTKQLGGNSKVTKFGEKFLSNIGLDSNSLE